MSSLTHWGRVMHICVSRLTIIGSDNGLSPDRRQAIIWTNAGISLIGPLGTKFNEMLIEIHTFSIKKMHFKMSSGKWRPYCLGLPGKICTWLALCCILFWLIYVDFTHILQGYSTGTGAMSWLPRWRCIHPEQYGWIYRVNALGTRGITTTKQKRTKQSCAYCMGYNVSWWRHCLAICWLIDSLVDRLIDWQRKEPNHQQSHYNDAIMSAMASQNTSLTIVYWTAYSRRRSKKTFDDVIMILSTM